MYFSSCYVRILKEKARGEEILVALCTYKKGTWVRFGKFCCVNAYSGVHFKEHLGGKYILTTHGKKAS